MAKSIIHAKVDASVYFIQAARNSKVQAFADELRNLVDVGPNVITKVIYSAPLPGDVENGNCNDTGFITTTLLRDWTPFSEANF